MAEEVKAMETKEPKNKNIAKQHLNRILNALNHSKNEAKAQKIAQWAMRKKGGKK